VDTCKHVAVASNTVVDHWVAVLGSTWLLTGCSFGFSFMLLLFLLLL